MARSFTDAPRVQPRLPSLFENGTVKPLAESHIFAEPSSPAKLSIAAAFPSLAQSIANASNSGAASSKPSLKDSPTKTNAEPDRDSGLLSESPRPPMNSETDPVQTMDTPTAPEAVKPILSLVASPTLSPAENHFTEADLTAEHQPAPARSGQFFSEGEPIQSSLAPIWPPNRRIAPRPFEQSSAISSPTIYVTIGRVEVHAIHAPAPAPKSTKPAPPKLSLENYLQQRDGGGR